MEQIEPFNDKVLVRPILENKSEGGIVIPTQNELNPDAVEGTRAKVLAVGPGLLKDDGTRQRPQIEVGETIILGKYGHIHFEVNNEKLLLICERDIAARSYKK